MSTRGISRSCLSASGNLSNRSNASAKSSDPITTQKMARRASVFIRSPLAFCRSSAPSCAAAAAAVELACLSSAPCAALAANHASVPAASGSHHWPLCLDSSIRRSWVSALQRHGGVADGVRRAEPLGERRGESPLVAALRAARAPRAGADDPLVVLQVDHHVQHQPRAFRESTHSCVGTPVGTPRAVPQLRDAGLEA